MPIRITWIPLALLLSLALAGTISSTAGAASAERRSAVKSLLEMRRQNVVLQQWDLSCAAAALATILRYQHGEVVTERSVALGLIDREEYIGLGQLDLPDLLERAPIIVPVHLQGYPHFVIFRGTLGNSVLLADPAFGNLSLSVEKFMAGWIYYRDIGRVGFLVTETGTPAPPGRLSASALDFVLLRP